MLLKDMSVNELENVLNDEKKKYDDFKKEDRKSTRLNSSH